MSGASKVVAKDFDQDGDLDIAGISFFPDFDNAPEKEFTYLQQENNFTFTASIFAQSKQGHLLTMEAGHYDQDRDIILGSFTYTPAPPAQQEKWRNEGRDIMVLQIKKRLEKKTVMLHIK